MPEGWSRAAHVLRHATRNPALRRLLVAYAAFEVGEYAIWIALLLYGFSHGGATGSLEISLVQLIPSALLAPFLGAVADRRSPGAALVGSYALSALAMGAVGFAIATSLPPAAVFALVPLESLSLTAARPAHAALMPAVVTSADELTASNVMAGWADALGTVCGPAVTGVLVAAGGAGLAIQVSAGLMASSTLLALAGLAAAASGRGASRWAPGSVRGGMGGTGLGGLLGEVTLSARHSIALVRESPETMALLALDGFSFALVGALEIVIIVLAVQVLRLGLPGAGYLTASLGAGSVLAGFVTLGLVGAPRLARILTTATIGTGTAVALLGIAPRVADAFVLLGLAGLGCAVLDVTTRTLLQRLSHSDSIAGAFSLLESLLSAGFAAGASVARLLVALAGPRAALLVLAALSLSVTALSWRRLRSIDDAANVPQVEARLLRSIPIFAALPALSLESVARRLVQHRVAAGTTVIVEGQLGDRYYAVAEGTLSVTRQHVEVAVLARGDGFGEIALVRNVARTATVSALTDATLYSLDQESFRSVLSGHAPARDAAEVIAQRRSER